MEGDDQVYNPGMNRARRGDTGPDKSHCVLDIACGETTWGKQWERKLKRCLLVQDEFAAARSEEIMFRECIDTLILEVASKESKKLFLIGPTGSGKSIALAAVVTKMRELGWLVNPSSLPYARYPTPPPPNGCWVESKIVSVEQQNHLLFHLLALQIP